jgi:Mrp family chromosome partitioning ATPase
MMNGELAQPSYLKQFLAGRKGKPAGFSGSGAGSYRDSFLSKPLTDSSTEAEAAGKPVETSDPDTCREASGPSFEKKEILIWKNNADRFPENELPALSANSVKQLEANFRELMLVEANISPLIKNGNALYVSSCFERDGKTIAAISTAFGLSFYSQKEVLLLDGNHHNPQLHNLFGVSHAPGFADLCAGTVKIEDIVLPTLHKGLSLMTIGSEDLPSPRERELEMAVGELCANFDYVICDGCAIMSSSAALRDIRHFSAGLLVIECEKTRWEVLQIAEDKIKKTGGPTQLGVIFNRRKYYIPSIVYKFISKK